MPIEIDPNEPKSPRVWDDREASVLRLLYSNPNCGYRPWDIAERTPISRNEVYNAVSRLHNRDMIGKTPDGYYFALNDAQVINYLKESRDDFEFH